MRKIFIALSILAAMLPIVGCKTTEKNYREAYEIAARKRQADADLDSLATGQLYSNGRPVVYEIDGDTISTRVEYVRVTKDANPDGVVLRRFNIIVGQFRQLFNAKSMAQSFRDRGYESFVVNTSTPQYYVVGGSYDTLKELQTSLSALEQDTCYHPIKPCPWVLQPPHLAK